MSEEHLIAVVRENVILSMEKLFGLRLKSLKRLHRLKNKNTKSRHSAFWYQLSDMNVKLKKYHEETKYHERKLEKT